MTTSRTAFVWGLFLLGMAVALGWEGHADWIGLGIIGTGVMLAWQT